MGFYRLVLIFIPIRYPHVTPPSPIGVPLNLFGPVRRLVSIHSSYTFVGGENETYTISQVSDIPRLNGDFSMHELIQRVHHLFETCNYREPFVNEDAWRKRACGRDCRVTRVLCQSRTTLVWGHRYSTVYRITKVV